MSRNTLQLSAFVIVTILCAPIALANDISLRIIGGVAPIEIPVGDGSAADENTDVDQVLYTIDRMVTLPNGDRFEVRGQLIGEYAAKSIATIRLSNFEVISTGNLGGVIAIDLSHNFRPLEAAGTGGVESSAKLAGEIGDLAGGPIDGAVIEAEGAAAGVVLAQLNTEIFATTGPVLFDANSPMPVALSPVSDQALTLKVALTAEDRFFSADGMRVDTEVRDGNGFLRGDVNGDSNVTLADPVHLLGYLFAQQADPACFDAADADDNGSVELGDGVRLLSYLFASGAAPAAPNLGCGADPTEDSLPDCSTSICE